MTEVARVAVLKVALKHIIVGGCAFRPIFGLLKLGGEELHVTRNSQDDVTNEHGGAARVHYRLFLLMQLV